MMRALSFAVAAGGSLFVLSAANAQESIRVGWTIPAEEAKYWMMRRPEQFPDLGKAYKAEWTQFQGTAPMVQAMVAMPVADVRSSSSTSSAARCSLRTSAAAGRGNPRSDINGASPGSADIPPNPRSASIAATAGLTSALAIASPVASRSITSHNPWQTASTRELPDARPLVLVWNSAMPESPS